MMQKNRTEKTVNYKDTLNLPRTSFSMKAGLSRMEPEMLEKWEKKDTYGNIIKKREGTGRTFVLHDGPPYANGNIHMGHVLNKILKDICVKYQAMKGCLSRYVPGWDCHGLPVEHQLFKELGMTKNDIGQVEFRKKAYKYAMRYVRIQAEEFKRLGIFGDWDNPYLTLTKEYEADILFSLADLYDKGYIYKGLKPVNWCADCETALAEAEVEYEDKISPSIYVKFESPLKHNGEKTFFIIWTTTPWTLLANVAIAVHPEYIYSFVSVNDETWIMLSDRVDDIMKRSGKDKYTVIDKISGKELSTRYKTARHPFIERDSAIVTADYVTGDEGTGCVHTAPGHGQDDYITGKKYGLPVIMPVDKNGRFTAEGGEFSGKFVLEANDDIVEKLSGKGALISAEKMNHSYPHCWRCKNPVIFRATEQWFMDIDHDGLRGRMIETIKNDVEWIPPSGVDRISAMVMNRPDWCISRQRYWGVPIPAFKCADCGEIFTTSGLIRKVAELTAEHGADVWFEKDADELRASGSKCVKCGGEKFEKEEDILDVWFDSGISHQAVLKARKDLSFPADLYLEGSDQHRGWFQSALITSMGMNGNAPYRKVLTHGFVVDGDGKKMSKSIGNVISPQDVMKKYGADILRLWVASSDYEADIKLSDEILARLSDGYRKIRNTFRYLLSNLYDFDVASDRVEYSDLAEIDKWMLSRLCGIVDDVTGFYDSWEFYRVYRTIYDFCVTDISSFYLDALKDVLYIYAPGSLERRSAQTAMFEVLDKLARLMAPVIAFTSDEVWGHMDFPGRPESVHMSDWPCARDLSLWRDEGLESKWRKILGMRDKVMKLIENKREKGAIGSSLEVMLTLHADDDNMKRFLNENVSLFPQVFRVSQVYLLDTPDADMENTEDALLKIGVKKAEGAKCPRCWNFSEITGEDERFPELCERCRDIMSERSGNGK